MGRPQGSVNRRSMQVGRVVQKRLGPGFNAIAEMCELGVKLAKRGDLVDAVDAFSKASKYLYPTLAAVHIDTNADNPVVFTVNLQGVQVPVLPGQLIEQLSPEGLDEGEVDPTIVEISET